MNLLQTFNSRTHAMNIPVIAHVDLTYRCNFICDHCLLPSQFGGEELSTPEAVRVLEELAELGTLFLTLSGGEVFLRKDLDEVLAAADRLRFRTQLYSHGNFLDEDRVQMLIRRHVGGVQISFYSVDPCVHEKVTRIPGSHAKSLRAIELLQDAGVRVVIACPVMHSNLPTLAETRDFAVRRGIPIRISTEIQPTYSGELHPLGTRVSGCDVTSVIAETLGDEKLKRLAEQPEHRFDKGTLCGAARSAVYISPTGEVQGCSLMGGLSAGNVRRTPLPEIWRNASIFKEIRGIHQENREDCKRCMNSKYCGFCMANSWQFTKTLLTPVAIKCDQSNATRLAVEAYKRRLPVVVA